MSPDRSGLAQEPLDQLARGLWWAVLVAAGLAAAGLAVPGRPGVAVAVAAIAVVVAAPLLRVLWLVVAWWRHDDRRFVLVGGALLGVVAAGAAIATQV